ncbi:uncharacterized protein LOC100891607 isoform X2 [Strongylocentrotus purpuratus]|uniref:DUF3504 domain-containing protein n=1 Tax=Strongylocentrotus purpuratus TaxID=7668 RepID=A0A7M7NMQ1_STRPU|nr:uncharacterized protein LOC100891607 isoform X2 [Strongylocentrotus purpuratus]
MAISIDSLKLDSLEVKEELVDEDYINHQVSVLMSDEELTPGSSAAGGVNEECEEEDDKLQGWINGPSNNYNAKRHTKYALSLFEIFSKRENVNFEDIDNKALDVLLSNFYKAARNKKGDLYALKSMQSIRFGLQRYFLESRGIDIIRSDEFSLSHKTFGAVSRKLKRFGKDKVRHHPQITVDDMARMQASLDLSIPQGLQHKVFLDTVLYFGRSGMRNLRTTRPGDFVLHQENNQLFYTFRENREAQMCAMPGNPRCPVANLKRYISKLNSNCEWMWQRPRQRFSDSEDPCIWYENSPLGKDNLSFMTRTISELAGCNKGYTIQSLRKSMTEKMLESLSRNDSTSQNRDYAITVIALPRSTSNSVVTRINKMITASPRVPVAAPITDSSMNIIENPSSVTASSSDKATNLQTMQQNTSVTSKSNTGVNEGTMTELTWIELPRKLVQSKDASTQWEKQPPTHSTHSTSTQDLYKPECGDDGELKQDGLGWCSEDEFMDSSEPSDVHIDGSSIVAWSRGDVEETTVAQSQEREQSNTPILRRIKEEMIEEIEEGDYQTLYVKEEYLEDECQDDDYAHVHLTSGGHPRLEAESPRSTQQTNSYRAPRQNGGPCIRSKTAYKMDQIACPAPQCETSWPARTPPEVLVTLIQLHARTAHPEPSTSAPVVNREVETPSTKPTTEAGIDRQQRLLHSSSSSLSPPLKAQESHTIEWQTILKNQERMLVILESFQNKKMTSSIDAEEEISDILEQRCPTIEDLLTFDHCLTGHPETESNKSLYKRRQEMLKQYLIIKAAGEREVRPAMRKMLEAVAEVGVLGKLSKCGQKRKGRSTEMNQKTSIQSLTFYKVIIRALRTRTPPIDQATANSHISDILKAYPRRKSAALQDTAKENTFDDTSEEDD